MAKILVVDDDRVQLFTLSEGLGAAGFEVLQADDGLKALALCRNESPLPDLALLDICMPGFNGLELAQRLRNETNVPFLILSAYSDEKFIQRAVEIGALGYMIKPLAINSILPMIRAALTQAQNINK